ncbi:hypothetical protein HYPSUDRAFT_66766 [Hypholoma sublateritium FD-334 SS-4]|uniref:MYND-type domain-containing protein n=1 Tax=Hypholoma sublateritium (strain FD-334 SS-4) TaxID=945553 RepID=A0A0D2P237_HYPSF|nr:hypothetical protein HYPSUDRAFT_66766 [Hypholoma sublateritium FD-334 SS-4]
MAEDKILREDLYFLLGSTGAILPPATKIADDGIRKRIVQAFDISQEIALLFGAAPIDTPKLLPWSNSKTIYAATRRGSLMEHFTGTMPKKGVHSAQWETFQEMRQTLDCIAFGIDSRVRDFLLVGPQNHWAVFVRVLDVRNAKDHVPFLFLVYKELQGPVSSIQDELANLKADQESIVRVSISALERYAWLTVLRRNTQRLSPGTHDLLEESGHNLKTLHLNVSFMLPLSPLSMESIGRITKDTGCDVCQKQDANICVGCRSAQYCGKECQQKDWPRHKAACKAVRGAAWRTFTPADFPSGVPIRQMFNTRESLHRPPDKLVSAGGAASAELGKLFLVKFQLGMVGRSSHMLMYDRTRAFMTQWWRASDPNLFNEAERIMGDRRKFYRWVKRISETQFEICLENGPEDPGW